MRLQRLPIHAAGDGPPLLSRQAAKGPLEQVEREQDNLRVEREQEIQGWAVAAVGLNEDLDTHQRQQSKADQAAISEENSSHFTRK